MILAAATDGSDRLRYVATEAIRPWVEARREAGEAAYLDMMRREVGLGPALPPRP